MKLDSNKKIAPEQVRSVLMAAAILLVAGTAAKIASCHVGPARAESVINQAMTRASTDANDLERCTTAAQELVGAMKEKNLFVKNPPEEHPIKQIDGILGSEVLISDKLYRAGDKVGEAVIVAIGPTEVTVEWHGKKKVFSVFGSEDRRPSPPSRPAPMVAKPKVSGPAQPVVEAAAVAVETSEEEDPLAWMGVTLSASARTKLLAMWDQLTDEQKAEAKEQWNNASDEEKQQAMAAFDQM
jgi:hypothetical protein